MAFDAYMLDALKEDTESRLSKGGNDSSAKPNTNSNSAPRRGSNEDTSMSESEKIADTSIGNNDVSAVTKRTETALDDLSKSLYVGNNYDIDYDSEFLDYQTKIIDSINIAYSAKPLYLYLAKQVSMQRGKSNGYDGARIDTAAVSTIKVPTYLINCLKQETGSLTKVKNGTLVVGFLVWYLGLNPEDFEDSDDIAMICDALGIAASPSKMSAHTGNMVQNIDDRMNDFEDAINRLTNLVEHVNTNMAQSEQNVGKVLMLSCYNALSLMGRATLVKMTDALDNVDFLDNMKVWQLMKSVDSSWLYNSRSEGREQYKRKCERDRKQVLYANANNQVVNTYGSNDANSIGHLGGNLRKVDEVEEDYQTSDFDPDVDYGEPDDEQLFSFDDNDVYDPVDVIPEEDQDDGLDEAIEVGNLNNMKNTDPAKYLKYMKSHRSEN